jgi:hypothetical protein
MALRKPTEKFEDVNETMIADANETVMDTSVEAANEARQPAEAPAPANVPAVRTTSTALATANEAAAVAKAFERELAEMQGAADFSYGTYAVFKGNNGELAQTGGSETSLGRWAKIRLLAWDTHFEVSPGSQDKTSKDFVGYSKDGKTMDSIIGEDQKSWVGKPVDAYLDYLKNTEGFEKAKCAQYVDMSCALLGTDSGEGPVGTVIQITLSQSSIPSFKKYTQSLKDTARCVSMGLAGFKMPEDPFTLFVIREVVAANGNRWTKLNFATSLPAKL